MTTTPPRFSFHIGAHKTATTHLQMCLQAAAEELALRGVRYHGPARFRLPGHGLPALFGLKPDAPGHAPRRAPAVQMAMLRGDAPHLVLSEENYIGPLNYPKGGAMRLRYKSAAQRLGALAEATGEEIAVFIGIRQPTGFLNSAYCQSLMGGQIMPVATYLDRNPVSSVDWLGLIAGLRTTPGIGPVTVWRYEDYGAVFDQIVTALVGAEAAPLVTPIARHVNRGLSAAAVAEVLHRADDPAIDLPTSVARHMLPVEAGYPPFDGFTDHDHAASAARYADQLAQIAALPGVRVLSPAHP